LVDVSGVLGELALGESHEPGYGHPHVARHDEPAPEDSCYHDVTGREATGADEAGAEPEAVDKDIV
jgi:hypothetical protein